MSVGVVVGLVLGQGVDELARGVNIAKEDIVDGVTGGLAERSAVEDTGDVLVGGPLVDKAGTDGVDDDDSVVAVVCDVVDKPVRYQLLRS